MQMIKKVYAVAIGLVSLLCTISCKQECAKSQLSAMELEYAKTWPKENKKQELKDTPNILFITSDQQHWMKIGYNDTTVHTPNLNRLASKGVIFDRAYTVNPTCTPTRASLITGKFPSQHGAWSLGTKLPETEKCVGDYLSEAGYSTFLIGKAHFQQLQGSSAYPSLEAYPVLQDYDFWKEFTGPFYGFQHVEICRNHTDEAHVGQHYVLWMEQKLKKAGKDPLLWKEWFRMPTGTSKAQYGEWNIPEEYHYNVFIAERTNALLEEAVKNKKPFFAWASFFDPHPSYIVPSKWAHMYQPEDMEVPELIPGELDDMPEHYRMTQALPKEADAYYAKFQEPNGDWCHGFHSHTVYGRGKVTKESKAEDMAIYYGMISMMDYYIGIILDKVEELGVADNTLIVFTSDHGHFLGEHGLVAKGPFHYEDVLKVPMIASWPGIIPQGKRTDALQSLVDITPTFLAAAGLPVPLTMSGHNRLENWKNDTIDRRDHVIIENRHQPTTMFQKTYINQRYKITWYLLQDEGEMFDLEKDPQELNNLWNNPEYKDLKLDLLLKAMKADMEKDPLVMPRVAAA